MFPRSQVEVLPSPTLGVWLIRRIGARESHRVSTSVVSVLAAVLAEGVGDCAAVAQLTGSGRSTVERCLEVLTEGGYLPSMTDVRDDAPPTQSCAAVSYIADTYDYPFERYECGRSDSDRARMAAYSAVHADEDRHRVMPDGRAMLVELPFPSSNIEVVATGSLLERVAHLMAIVAVPTMKAHAPWLGQPLWRKTSPSGGSRHPTELYLQVVDGLRARTFYVDPAARRVVSMDDDMDADGISRAWDHCEGDGRVNVIVTSRFARNMYRYREPRTFRTVFLDVGHVVGTLRLAAGELGLRVVRESARWIGGSDDGCDFAHLTEFPSVRLVITDVRGPE